MRKAALGVAIGLGVLTLSFAVLGLVVNNQANFSKRYVHDQLAEKQITFTPVENLLPNQKTVPCLVENAGKQLVTGKQAECYARYQIGLDLALIDNGQTYFEDLRGVPAAGEGAAGTGRGTERPGDAGPRHAARGALTEGRGHLRRREEAGPAPHRLRLQPAR